MYWFFFNYINIDKGRCIPKQNNTILYGSLTLIWYIQINHQHNIAYLKHNAVSTQVHEAYMRRT